MSRRSCLRGTQVDGKCFCQANAWNKYPPRALFCSCNQPVSTVGSSWSAWMMETTSCYKAFHLLPNSYFINLRQGIHKLPIACEVSSTSIPLDHLQGRAVSFSVLTFNSLRNLKITCGEFLHRNLGPLIYTQTFQTSLSSAWSQKHSLFPDRVLSAVTFTEVPFNVISVVLN